MRTHLLGAFSSQFRGSSLHFLASDGTGSFFRPAYVRLSLRCPQVHPSKYPGLRFFWINTRIYSVWRYLFTRLFPTRTGETSSIHRLLYSSRTLYLLIHQYINTLGRCLIWCSFSACCNVSRAALIKALLAFSSNISPQRQTYVWFVWTLKALTNS